jgi:hypothetical protein
MHHEAAHDGAATAGPVTGGPARVRRVLVPALAAVLATAVAVPVTWYVATREPALTVPPAFASRSELREHLTAQLTHRERDGTVVLEASYNRENLVAVSPGRYRVDLICGLMRRRGTEPQDLSLYLRASNQLYEITIPCPSTVQSLPDPLDFTDSVAGAVLVYMNYADDRTASMLLLQLVPEGAGEGGADA